MVNARVTVASGTLHCNVMAVVVSVPTIPRWFGTFRRMVIRLLRVLATANLVRLVVLVVTRLVRILELWARFRLNYSMLLEVSRVTGMMQLLLVPSMVALLGSSFRMTLSPVRVTCLSELNLLRRVILISSITIAPGGVTWASCVTLLTRPVFTLVMKKWALVPICNVANGKLTLPPKELTGVMAGFNASSSVESKLPAAAPFIELANLTRLKVLGSRC